MVKECSICDWISRINVNEQNYFVIELKTGFVFISKSWQYFKGYTIFVSKICVNEIHELPLETMNTFLIEMTAVSEAVKNAFGAVKINCESLGNSASHVHWHIIPRYGTDPIPGKAIWNIERDIIESVDLNDEETIEIRDLLRKEIFNLGKKYSLDI